MARLLENVAASFPGGLGGACAGKPACAWVPPICVWENGRWHGWLAVPIGGHFSANSFASTRAPQTPRNPIASSSQSASRDIFRRIPSGWVARTRSRCCGLRPPILILLNVALLLVAAFASLSTAADATLRLTSGDYVEGKLLPLASGDRLRWQSPIAVSPLEFSLDAIAAVDFKRQQSSDEPPEFCFELVDGDVLFGRLASLSEQTCVIDSEQFGRLAVEREAVRQISKWGEGDNLVYLGPERLDQWKQLTPDRPWREVNGHLITEKPRSSIFGNVGAFPEQAGIEIEASWTKSPDFSIELGVFRNSTVPSHPFRLEVWDEIVMLVRDGDQQGDLTWLRDLPEKSGRLHLQLYLDRKQGRLLAYAPDGSPLGKLEVPSRESLRGSAGIRIANRRGGVRIERLRITRWDGQPPQQIDQRGARLQLTDGTFRYGDIQFREDDEQFIVRRPDQSEAYPSSKVSAVVWPSPPQNSDDNRGNRTLRVLLQDGSHLSGRLAGVADNALLLIHPHAQAPVRLPLDQFNALIARRSEEAHSRQPTDDRGPVGRLETEGTQLHGTLVDSAAHDQPLVFRPRGSVTASGLRPQLSGRIVYREPPPPPSPQFLRRARPQQPGLLNGIVRAFSGNGVRPAPGTAITTSIHLRTGDVIPCHVTAIDARGVHMKTPNFDADLVPHDRIKAAVLWAGSSPSDLDELKRQRLLTLPRMQKNNPPTHLLCSKDGDYLRCRLISLDKKSVVVETRLETKTIDRRTLARIIWLADEPAPSAEAPAEPGAEMQVQAVRSDGVRITFAPERFAEGVLHGTSEVLGACRTAVADIDQLLIGQRIHEVAAHSAFQQWRLHDAPQPRFMTEEDGEAGPPGVSELTGKPAPEFELDLLDGSRFHLEETRGKIVVLDFWATWCGPCIQAMPRIAAVVDEFADHDVEWIAVNLQESKGRIESSLDRLDLDVTVALDEDGIVAHRYQVSGIPQTVVIDRAGNVAKLFIGGGPQFEEQLRATIEALVEGED